MSCCCLALQTGCRWRDEKVMDGNERTGSEPELKGRRLRGHGGPGLHISLETAITSSSNFQPNAGLNSNHLQFHSGSLLCVFSHWLFIFHCTSSLIGLCVCMSDREVKGHIHIYYTLNHPRPGVNLLVKRVKCTTRTCKFTHCCYMFVLL